MFAIYSNILLINNLNEFEVSFVLFVLFCGNRRFFNYAAESVKKEWRPEPRQGGGRSRGPESVSTHSNLS